MEKVSANCFCLAMTYKRAPITEAVVEFRLGGVQEQSIVEKAAASLKKEYFYDEIEQLTQFEVDAAAAQKPPKVEVTWQGRKLSSLDRADVVIFRRGAFVCSRLAPYMGWEEFFPQIERGWSALRKAAGAIEISRIGVRYVNRIDIPVREGDQINAEDYLNYLPRSPIAFNPMTDYVIQTSRPLGEDDLQFSLLSSTVPSPLINTLSLSLDLDVFREGNVPRRDDELWNLLNRIREHKNVIFEACITDRTRELFQ